MNTDNTLAIPDEKTGLPAFNLTISNPLKQFALLIWAEEKAQVLSDYITVMARNLNYRAKKGHITPDKAIFTAYNDGFSHINAKNAPNTEIQLADIAFAQDYNIDTLEAIFKIGAMRAAGETANANSIYSIIEEEAKLQKAIYDLANSTVLVGISLNSAREVESYVVYHRDQTSNNLEHHSSYLSHRTTPFLDFKISETYWAANILYDKLSDRFTSIDVAAFPEDLQIPQTELNWYIPNNRQSLKYIINIITPKVANLKQEQELVDSAPYFADEYHKLYDRNGKKLNWWQNFKLRIKNMTTGHAIDINSVHKLVSTPNITIGDCSSIKVVTIEEHTPKQKIINRLILLGATLLLSAITYGIYWTAPYSITIIAAIITIIITIKAAIRWWDNY